MNEYLQTYMSSNDMKHVDTVLTACADLCERCLDVTSTAVSRRTKLMDSHNAARFLTHLHQNGMLDLKSGAADGGDRKFMVRPEGFQKLGRPVPIWIMAV